MGKLRQRQPPLSHLLPIPRCPPLPRERSTELKERRHRETQGTAGTSEDKAQEEVRAQRGQEKRGGTARGGGGTGKKGPLEWGSEEGRPCDPSPDKELPEEPQAQDGWAWGGQLLVQGNEREPALRRGPGVPCPLLAPLPCL